MTTAIKKVVLTPYRIIFITAGLAWIGRAILGVIFRPDYWDPHTAIDYSAIALMSLALILLAVSVGTPSIWLHRRPDHQPDKRPGLEMVE
jgi:hypothetical protein